MGGEQNTQEDTETICPVLGGLEKRRHALACKRGHQNWARVLPSLRTRFLEFRSAAICFHTVEAAAISVTE